jgi:hypothetical protein
MGATMEDDMVADAALWVIFAVSIAFIWFGCRMTKPVPKVAEPNSEAALDRAA